MPTLKKRPNTRVQAPSAKPPKNKVNKLLNKLNRKVVGAPGQLGTLANNPQLSERQEANLQKAIERKRKKKVKKTARKARRQERLDKAANFKPSFI
jgi:hypothetical protein